MFAESRSDTCRVELSGAKLECFEAGPEQHSSSDKSLDIVKKMLFLLRQFANINILLPSDIHCVMVIGRHEESRELTVSLPGESAAAGRGYSPHPSSGSWTPSPGTRPARGRTPAPTSGPSSPAATSTTTPGTDHHVSCKLSDGILLGWDDGGLCLLAPR